MYFLRDFRNTIHPCVKKTSQNCFPPKVSKKEPKSAKHARYKSWTLGFWSAENHNTCYAYDKYMITVYLPKELCL